MPADERSSRTAHLSEPTSQQEWLAALRGGELAILGRMPWSSNATFLVLVTSGERTAQGIYKPGRGERPLRDFPDRIYRREVAAYELAEAIGLHAIPETVIREEGPYGEGSLQRFIDADYQEHYFTLVEVEDNEPALREIAALDILLNNADRKGGHVLAGPDGHIWGIDNGLSFSIEDKKLRTVMWDFAGETVPDIVLAGCELVVEEVPPPVAQLLSPRECEALQLRAVELLEVGEFPYPDPMRRTHPWPLV
jgi:uncharacterized repeat protein (TIGR03843 family)